MLTPAQARQAIDQTFTMSAANLPPQTLVLKSVTLATDRNRPSHLPEAFSMLLVGTKSIYCPQGTYLLENATLGALEVFIVPVAHDTDTDEYTYELIFN